MIIKIIFRFPLYILIVFRIRSAKWAGHQRWRERLSRPVVPSLCCCIFTCVLINSCCMWLPWPHPTSRVYVCVCFLHYHNLCMCVCVCVCVRASVCRTPGESVRLQGARPLSPWWTSCSDVYRALLFNSGALKKKKKKKPSRDGGINGIKRRKRKQSGINIANRNSFWLLWGLWQWKKRALSPPVCVCVCTYLSICSVFYIISTCAGVCVVFM